MNKVVTRIPPSPTGHLHIGTARTALYNYLFARRHGGSFIIRSEDTDKARSTREFETEILEGLEWLGITSDAYTGDDFYRQSEHAPLYRSYLERIINNGSAFISKEESKNEPGKEVAVVRLKNPNKVITFTDEIRGEITFDTTELGDFVIARSLDDALYHFTVVVDDHEMGVTHVIRGEDHISNTPRQILIQEAIGAARPVYAHLPLILAADRSKMSKRHGAVALYDYRDQGFLKEAIINYLALLGWNPGTDQEIFSMDELIATFDLGKIQKSGAIFDIEKLRWFNREYLKRADDAIFESALTKTAGRQVPDRVRKNLIATLRERSFTLGDIARDYEAGEYDYAFTAPDIDPQMLKWKKDPELAAVTPRLRKVLEILEATPDSDNPEIIKRALWSYAEEVGRGEVLWPLRVALSGREKSPDPFTLIATIGVPEAIRRVEVACAKIGG